MHTGKYILKRYIQKSSKYHTCQSYQVILSHNLLQLSDQCLHDLSTKISEGKKMKEDIFEEKKTFNTCTVIPILFQKSAGTPSSLQSFNMTASWCKNWGYKKSLKRGQKP